MFDLKKDVTILPARSRKHALYSVFTILYAVQNICLCFNVMTASAHTD